MSRTVQGKGNSNVAMWLSGDIPGALCIRIHCKDVPGTAYLSIVDAEELIEHLHQFTTGKLEEPEKEDKPKCGTCEDTKRILVSCQTSQSFTGKKWIPCPGCGESGEGKTVNIGGVEFKEIDAATAEEACAPRKGGEFHVTPKYKATGITESEYKGTLIDECFSQIKALKKRIKELEAPKPIFDYAHVTAYEKAVLNCGEIRELKKRMEELEAQPKERQKWQVMPDGVIRGINPDLETRIEVLHAKLNERIEKSKAWSKDVIERLGKLEGESE